MVRRRRRKKASSSHRKPPLIFTDSPLNGTYQPVESVLAAADPATAEVVPIDPDSNFPWISPHFHYAVPSTRKIRTTKSLRHREPVLSVTTSNRNVSAAAMRRTCHPNTVKLRFVGDDDDDETIDSDDADVTGQKDDDTPLAGDCETPERNIQQRLQDCNNDDDDSRRTDICHRRNYYTRIKARNGGAGEKSHIYDGCDVATQRAKRTKDLPARRLFSGGNIQNLENLQEQCNVDVPDISFECTRRAYDPTQRLMNHSMNASVMNCSLPTIHSVRRPSRCSRHTLFNDDCATPEPQKPPGYKVLAFDTPVTDYGLPVRLRRFRGRLQI